MNDGLNDALNDTIPNAWVAVALFGGIIAFAALKLLWGAALWTRRTPHRVGDRWGAELIEVKEWSQGKGYVMAGGELWRAASKDALAPGDRVTVLKSKGLTLEVRKA